MQEEKRELLKLDQPPSGFSAPAMMVYTRPRVDLRPSSTPAACFKLTAASTTGRKS